MSRGGLLQPTWWEGRCLGRCCTSSCWAVSHWQWRTPAPAHSSPGGAQAQHQQNRLPWSQPAQRCCPRAKCALQGGILWWSFGWRNAASWRAALSNILDEGVQRRSAGMTAYTAKLSPVQRGLELLNWEFGSCEDKVSNLLHVNVCWNAEQQLPFTASGNKAKKTWVNWQQCTSITRTIDVIGKIVLHLKKFPGEDITLEAQQDKACQETSTHAKDGPETTYSPSQTHVSFMSRKLWTFS